MKTIVTIIIVCLSTLSTFGQQSLSLKIINGSDKPNSETEHIYLLEVTNNSKSAVNFNISADDKSCSDTNLSQIEMKQEVLNSQKSKNIELNKLAGKVISINGDASEIIKEQLVDKSDRTLMLLPERSDEFLKSAICTTKNGGIIHYYSHIHADKKSEAGKLSEEHYLQVTPVQSKILSSKIVRAVGPRYYQTVVDVKISK